MNKRRRVTYLELQLHRARGEALTRQTTGWGLADWTEAYERHQAQEAQDKATTERLAILEQESTRAKEKAEAREHDAYTNQPYKISYTNNIARCPYIVKTARLQVRTYTINRKCYTCGTKRSNHVYIHEDQEWCLKCTQRLVINGTAKRDQEL